MTVTYIQNALRVRTKFACQPLNPPIGIRETPLVACCSIGQQNFALALIITQHCIGKRLDVLAAELRGAFDRRIHHGVRRGLTVFELIQRCQQQGPQLGARNRFSRELAKNSL